MSSLEQEVRTLQRQVRRQRRWNLALGALVVVGGSMAATAERSIPDVVQAKKFEVVNDEGEKLVSLENLVGGGVDHGQVVTWSSTGRPLAGFSAGPGGGTVHTANGKGQMLVELGATRDGNAGMVTTWNSDRKVLVELGAGKSGGLVSVRDHQGRQLAQVTSDAGGKGGVLRTMNPSGEDLVLVGMSVDGFGLVRTRNGKGGTLTELGASKEGAGIVITENGEGKVLVELGAMSYGTVRTANPEGQTLVLLTANKSTGMGGVLTFDRAGNVTSVNPAP